MDKQKPKKRKFPKKEKNLIKEVMDRLSKKVPGMFYWKTHGEPMMVRGIPDVVCCVEGFFVGLEFKIMRAGKLAVTPYQEYTLDAIFKAGGAAFVIWWDEKNGDIGIQMRRFKNEKDYIGRALEYLLDEIIIYKSLLLEGKDRGKGFKASLISQNEAQN